MSDVTIYDVAEKAGVSIATVSNAINAPTRVKPATLKRVLAAIDELGFEPKTEAIARARKGLGRIGVVAPFTAYASFNQRLRGVIEALRDSPLNWQFTIRSRWQCAMIILSVCPSGDGWMG